MPVLGDCEVFDVASDAVSDTFRDANGLFGMTVDIVRHLPIGGQSPTMRPCWPRCAGAVLALRLRRPGELLKQPVAPS